MEITEYFSADNKSLWIEKIKESDWTAGQFLHELLKDDKLKELCGKKNKSFNADRGQRIGIVLHSC